nr:thymidylate synthase [Rhodococcus sp. (in: high G+C Gram-positive bacteria)]
MNNQYERLLQETLYTGGFRPDRTGTGTYGLFAKDLRYKLSDGFPAITTKKLYWKGVVGELIWFLSGNTNVKYLQDNNIRIWDEWADENGNLGPVYGRAWRDFGGHGFFEGVDQVADVIDGIRKDPYGRRHLVSAWNPLMLREMALPPCHFAFQFYVNRTVNDPTERLSCRVFQRSADLFLGVPFNIASYALLTHMVAAQTGYAVGELVWSGTDVHVYANHRNQVREQISRDVRPFPTLHLAERNSIFDYRLGDASLIDYNPHDAIKAEVAV